ncbi:MAG: pentapeptide repeat-containing protein [Nitrosopumilaceae archaeon]|nr:pentapeptide repeat-containing protein [Nitrosopumilaceae archaeon]
MAAVAALAAQDAHGTTTIDGTEVSWDIADSKGHTYVWSMPVTTYEDNIVESRYHVRDKVNLDLDGETLRVVSLDGFVKESFVNVIDGIYDNSHGNSDFIWEVWHVVSQLTVYDEDIHEYSEGRYALETLTRGGGDCEDLVILVADMLMSSSHTDGWTIQYVMMDSDNPTDPQGIDHVILYVNDGEYAHYIEATGPPSWDYYPEGVTGWYLDVVLYMEDLDFVGQDLRWMDLAGRNLAGAVFTDARLTGADMTNAGMSFADLSGAEMVDAIVSAADLSYADLSLADLTFADLSLADLTGADLSYADLTFANLYKTDLSSAVLTGAILTSADLSYADLSFTILPDADLSYADLTEANLSVADMSFADLSYTDLSYAVLSDAVLPYADLTSADLRWATMINTDLSYADLSYANLSGTVLVWTDLTGADLTGVDLSETVLYGVTGR